MNKLLSFTGGKPDFNIDDILWNDEATRNALNDVFRGFGGDNFIIQGCELSGSTVSAGYIMLDGELLKVDSHTKTSTHFVKVTTYDAGGDVTFNDGTPRQTWQINRATVTAGSGSLEYVNPAWTTITLINGYLGTVKARVDKFGYIEIIGERLRVASKTSDSFAVLPTGFRPDYDFNIPFLATSANLDAIFWTNSSPFELKTTQNGGLDQSNFYKRFPKTMP